MNLEINGATRILAVVADPVVQARTPTLANTALRDRGLLGRWVLVPMHVSASGFAAFLAGVRTLQNFAGAVISMPHKVVASDFVDEMSDEARLVGAVNVIRRTPEGRLIGTILDGQGFVAGLARAGHEVSGARVLLLGAGGAAAAIAFALARGGCASLCIQNRRAEAAAALARRVQAAFPAVQLSTTDLPSAGYDIAINATPLGMRPLDDLPMPISTLERCELVAECVLAPERTPLLDAAHARGKQVHRGIVMLEEQVELMLTFMGAI
jgi:shikimate dehydrogenase